jgi:hypothetical protein
LEREERLWKVEKFKVTSADTLMSIGMKINKVFTAFYRNFDISIGGRCESN